MTEADDPIGFAVYRWLALMGIPEPTEQQYQTFLVYNLAIPDVETWAVYDCYVSQLLKMECDAFLSANDHANIWFHITLFKAASYEIETGITGVLHKYYPDTLADFVYDHALGFDPALMAKAHGCIDVLVMH